jgi:hypothetical protein
VSFLLGLEVLGGELAFDVPRPNEAEIHGRASGVPSRVFNHSRTSEVERPPFLR